MVETIIVHRFQKLCAIIAALDIAERYRRTKINIHTVTFGAPGIGNTLFVDSVRRNLVYCRRIVHFLDEVPNLPILVDAQHAVEPIVFNNLDKFQFQSRVRAGVPKLRSSGLG